MDLAPDSSTVRCALISTDTEFRASLRQALQRSQRPIQVALDFDLPFSQLGEEHLRQMRGTDTELVILDLELDPVLGLRFAQFLSDQAPQRRIVATGPMLPPEQLLVAIRAGIAEYLPKPVAPDVLTTALETVTRRMRSASSASPQQPGKLFAIFSPKGGSGSTTVATNLAVHLHRLTGKRTLLLDLDLELGEIALQLGIEPRFSFLDMVRNFHRMDAELLASYIETHPSGVHLLSAPYHPERSEMVTGDQIARILLFLKRHYEYVVVDTSKSFNPATLATFDQADRIYLVTVADLPSLRNITRCLPLLKQFGDAGEDRVQMILNRYNPDDEIGAEDIESTLGLKVYWTIANDYDAVMRSINSGIPIILNGTSRYAEDVKALVAEIAGLRDTVVPGGSGRLRRTLVDPLARALRRTVQREPEARA